MSTDVVIIVNPVAGSGQARDLVGAFRERLESAGHRCRLIVASDPHALARHVRENAGQDRVIVIGGGDGTVRAALRGITPGAPARMLLLPLGTENLLARQLGIWGGLNSIWSMFTAGRTVPFDLAMVNGEPVATVIGAGFDAAVVARVVAERRGHITYLDYFWPLWRTFWDYRFPAIRVLADGQEVCNEPALVFVGNIPRYAIGLQILRQARWDDGLLDLCVMRCSHQGPLLNHVFWAFLNWHVEHPWVTYRQVKRVRLESRARLPLQCDGDAAGYLPVEIEVAPAAVNFFVPPETAAATDVRRRSA